jgi:hypothetical protein
MGNALLHSDRTVTVLIQEMYELLEESFSIAIVKGLQNDLHAVECILRN